MIDLRDMQPQDYSPGPQSVEREVAYEGVVLMAQGTGTRAFRLPDGRWVSISIIADADVADALAAYDPTSGTSPLVAIARPIARGHLDALRAADSRTSRSSSSDG